MAFTELERVKVRRWLGYSALYLNSSNTLLESALTSVQSIADGGARPDSTTETTIRTYLAKLDALEARWVDMSGGFEASKTDEITTDHVRGQLAIHMVMRVYIGHISDVLGTSPLRDVLSPAESLT